VGDDACCGFGGFGGQRAALEVIARSQTAPHREVQRAQVLLFAAEGLANARINTRVGVSPATVRAWRARFAQEGLAKLGTVRHGRGRKSTIPQAKIDEIVELTRHSKPGGADPRSCGTMAQRVGVSLSGGTAGMGGPRVEATPGACVQAVQRPEV